MIKKIIIGIGILVVLVIGGVVALYMNLGKIVKAGTEKTLSFVLEVDVTLDNAKVSPLGGEVVLTGLTVGNPDGFETASAFQFDETRVKVDLKSFKTDTPVINIVSITDPKITLEQGLRKSNLSTLIKSTQRFGTGGGDEPPAEEEEEAPAGSSKKMLVEKVKVEGSTVALSAPILKGNEVSYTLPTLELNDLGGEGQYIQVAEALKIFLTEILKASVEQGPGDLPGQLKAELEGTLSDIGSNIEKSIGDLGDKVGEKLGEGVGGAVGESLGGAAEKATGKIKGLLDR